MYCRRGWLAAHGVEGIDAVEDVDLMAATAERLAEPVHVGGVAAEAVTAEERGDHAELQRRPPVALALRSVARRAGRGRISGCGRSGPNAGGRPIATAVSDRKPPRLTRHDAVGHGAAQTPPA